MHGTRFFVFTFETDKGTNVKEMISRLKNNVELPIEHIHCYCFAEGSKFSCKIEMFTSDDISTEHLMSVIGSSEGITHVCQEHIPYGKLKRDTLGYLDHQFSWSREDGFIREISHQDWFQRHSD